MPTSNLLLEIGTEELPPSSLQKLESALASQLSSWLTDAGIDIGEVQSFSTPRRLAVLIANVANQQHDKDIERRGPSLSAAYDDNQEPSRALQGFMKSCGISDAGELETLETDKGTWVVFRSTEQGQTLSEIVEPLINKIVNALPVDRRMRWGSSRSEFVRPVQWLVLMADDEVIDATILGRKSGSTSRGHRFMSAGDITIPHAREYATVLRTGHVVADFSERKQIINRQLDELATELGAEIQVDPELLDEVTALVEWPCALAGSFDQSFLDVPEEALISAMKKHQRYFHVRNSKGDLQPRFVTVANIDSDNPAEVVKGNERVIRPRLADAKFFYEKDLLTTLTDKLERMKNVVFQADLGSYYDKATRISALSKSLAQAIGADANATARAGLLCKADLVSDMVGEFPDLQGVMGGYYAEKDGEPTSVANAIRSHYQPTFAGDELPDAPEGCCVAIADKLDTLVGIFGIGQAPTGSRDPFALRRQMLGVIRICIEQELSLNIKDALTLAASQFDKPFDTQPLYDYCLDRLSNWYADRGISPDVFDAVRRGNDEIDNLLEANLKVTAVQAFVENDTSAALIAANKRVANILRKQGAIEPSIDPAHFVEAAELELYTAKNQLSERLANLSYADKLSSLAEMQPAIDKYFADVMVMAEEETLRNNRLAMLAALRDMFNTVADFSVIQQ